MPLAFFSFWPILFLLLCLTQQKHFDYTTITILSPLFMVFFISFCSAMHVLIFKCFPVVVQVARLVPINSSKWFTERSHCTLFYFVLSFSFAPFFCEFSNATNGNGHFSIFLMTFWSIWKCWCFEDVLFCSFISKLVHCLGIKPNIVERRYFFYFVFSHRIALKMIIKIIVRIVYASFLISS